MKKFTSRRRQKGFIRALTSVSEQIISSGLSSEVNQALSVSPSIIQVGDLARDGNSTPEQIALVVPVTGTVSATATATCRYRVTGAGSWTQGHPLYRVVPSASTVPTIGTVEDVFAWTIIDVLPNTSYDVEVTIDDGGEITILNLTTSTRALPSVAGAATVTISPGATASEIQTAVNGLTPGSVLFFENGSYTISGLTLNLAGTVGSPIYIRGESRSGVTLTDTTGAIFTLQNVSNVIIENMTIVGSNVDSGTAASSVAFSQGAFSAVNLTIRNIIATGIDRAVDLFSSAQGTLVYDCTFTGNNLWQTTPVDFLGSNITWNDAGVKIPGNGNCCFNVTIKGFGDTFSVASHSGSQNTSGPDDNIHFYRCRVENSIDDPLEVDYGRRNITMYDCMITNAANSESLDPLFGGPFISARNIVINPYRVATHKWNDQNSGQFIYNLTVVSTTRNGTDFNASVWYQPNNGAQNYYGVVNCIHIHTGSPSTTLWLDNFGYTNIDFCNNAWNINSGIEWGDNFYANLALAQANLPATTPIFHGKQRHQDDVLVSSAPFATAITLGANSNTEVTVQYEFSDLAISVGENAKNAGLAIPNITDGFSGAAPDMGAVIEGRPTPTIGDRTDAIPAYLVGMADYDARQLTSQYAPASGETIQSVTPAEWIPGPGNIGLRGVIDTWCGGGGVIRPNFIDAVLVAHGGGHGDSANNGIYIYDLSENAGLPGGFENPVDISAVSAVQTETAAYTDGRPTSVHTYDGMVEDPSTGLIYRFGGSGWISGGFRQEFWQYDRSQPVGSRWTQLALPPFSGNTPGLWHDPVNGKLIAWSSTGGLAVYDIASNTWGSNLEASPPFGYSTIGAYDYTRENLLLYQRESASFTGVYNLNMVPATETVDSYNTATFIGSAGIPNGTNAGCVFDPYRDRFWFLGHRGQANVIAWCNAADVTGGGNITVTEQTISQNIGDSHPGDYWGMFSRFALIGNYLFTVMRHNTAPWAIKLPDA